MTKKLTIKLVNLRDEASVSQEGRVTIVDRRSPLGNPYRLGSEAKRAERIGQYRRWLWDVLQKRDSKAYDMFFHLAKHLMKSGRLVLACWCIPKPCHSQVIAAALAWFVHEIDPDYETEVI